MSLLEVCSMEVRTVKYVHNWKDRKFKCHFCGINLSVKYQVIIVEDGEEKEVYCCNRCVFLHDIK